MKNHLPKLVLFTSLLVSGTVMAAKKDDAKKALYEADVLIKVAERSDAQAHAVYELKSARDNVNQAKVEFDDNNWDEAEIAAKKAQRDAEVADAKSQALKAEKSLSDLQSVVNTLREELRRAGGSK